MREPDDWSGRLPGASGEPSFLPTSAELDELENALRHSATLRALAGRALRWIESTLARIEEQEEAETAILVPEPESPPVELRVRSLRIGPAEVPVVVPDTGEPAPDFAPPSSHEPIPDFAPEPERDGRLQDLALVTRRARLKAECCRWAVARRRRLADGADFEQGIRPVDAELGERARALRDCRAWPLDPYAALPGADAALEDLAGCYESLAQACELVRNVRADERSGGLFLEEAYQLMAEAQSALRVGLSELAEIDNDRDQIEAFEWLRYRTMHDQVYIPRHMRLGDGADPTRWHDLQARLDDLRARQESGERRWRRKKSLFNRLRFHGRRIEEARAKAGRIEDWERIDYTVGELLEDGLPPSNVELRELLLPWIDRLPDDYAPSEVFERVLHELDRFLASRETESREVPHSEPTTEVRNVAQLLRGKRVVLIGGLERPKSREALERAFELDELRWISTIQGRSYTSFEPEIARPETGLVLLAIRWSSHSFENAKLLCERHGKPFVRLPAGYSPNRVALEVLSQASEQLRRA